MIYVYIGLLLITLYLIISFICFVVIFKRPKPLDYKDPLLFPYDQEYIPKYYKEILKREKEEIFIKSFDNIKLQAYLFTHTNAKATIILVHGHASFGLHDFCPAFDKYYDFGYNVLIISNRGHYKSGGKFFTFGIKEAYDIKSWCEYISNRFTNLPIRLSGISLGSSTCMYSSCLDLPNVISIVSDCGFTSPYEEVLHVMKHNFHINGKFILFPVNIYAKIFLKINMKYSTTTSLLKSKYPILFIHGTIDNYVPFEMGVRNYNSCTSFKMKVFVEGAKHAGAYFVDRALVDKAIDEFFAITMKNE
jgi:fermentation-respiration switch protein FrsA (DUF1100 family)